MKKIILFTLIFISNILSVYSQNIYVDDQLATDCNGNYSITNRNCNGSDGNGYRTLESAASFATAGTTVLIREGIFNEQISPQYSGTVNAKITFKNYNNEEAVISGVSLSPAIMIYEKEYIVIDGLIIRDVRRWLNALGSSNNIIKNNIFENAIDSGGSSKTGLFFQNSDFNKIIDNVIDNSTQDNIGLVQSNYNLIEGNTISKATHVLWTLKCSNNNVIRNNYFHNEIQKIGEIYDCDNVGYGDAPYEKITSLDDTKNNVVENNVFAFTASSGDASPYSGIQYAGQNGIVRGNVFYECTGPAISLTIYSDEALNNYGNRFYNNVFYNNKFSAFDISGSSGTQFSDQKIKNNILFKNVFIQNDYRWSWYTELDDEPVQVITGRLTDVIFDNNALFSTSTDELYLINYGARNSGSNEAPKSLSWWETNRGNFIKNSLEEAPLFVSPELYDFSLQESSAMIDSGAFLANTTSSASSSTEMLVDDAKWFMNGFGIEGVSGDIIQLEGQAVTAVITDVDYSSNTLTLSTPLSWVDGQGVSLLYFGNAPDVGAFEFTEATLNNEDFDETNPSIKIYPNPTSGQLTIINNELIIRKIDVVDLAGKIVKTITSNFDVININALAEGLYFFKISTVDGLVIKKIIKK
ncbi:T9SS type A sorting domain-containing protein [Winogradskyella wichelsiae]|uniref:T9SS type A sorting domain-containing protein n=1 Tax=Winogradskyella wichelsiae TaxID=2697007 RepID=UPI0015CE2181|nr:T9SS type A sorting domain-containing protein [Winogradskyella wichelsiae]